MPSPYSYATGYPFGDPSQFTRSTGEAEINRFNQWMRTQPWYQNYLKSQGLVDTGRGVQLRGGQQEAVERLLAQQGIQLPGAFKIDPAGNINQKNRLARNLAIGAAAGAGAFFGGPALLGALGAGGGGGAATGAAIPALGTAGAIAPTAGMAALPASFGALPVAGALAGAGIPALGAAGAIAPTAGMAALPASFGAAPGGGMAGAGGWLSTLRNLSDIGSLASEFGRGAAEERSGENLRAQSADQLLANLFRTQQEAALERARLEEAAQLSRAKLGVEAPQARLNQILRASMMANLQPASLTGLPSRVAGSVPQLRGGLATPLSPEARRGANEMLRQALDALFTKSDVPAMPKTADLLLPAPTPTPYKGPGAMETIASLGGLGLRGAGVLAGQKLPRYNPNQPPVNPLYGAGV